MATSRSRPSGTGSKWTAVARPAAPSVNTHASRRAGPWAARIESVAVRRSRASRRCRGSRAAISTCTATDAGPRPTRAGARSPRRASGVTRRRRSTSSGASGAEAREAEVAVEARRHVAEEGGPERSRRKAGDRMARRVRWRVSRTTARRGRAPHLPGPVGDDEGEAVDERDAVSPGDRGGLVAPSERRRRRPDGGHARAVLTVRRSCRAATITRSYASAIASGGEALGDVGAAGARGRSRRARSPRRPALGDRPERSR